MEMSVVPVTLINLNKVDRAIAFFLDIFIVNLQISLIFQI